MSLGRLQNGDGCVCVCIWGGGKVSKVLKVSKISKITSTISSFDIYEGSVKSVQRVQMVGLRRTGRDFAPPPNLAILPPPPPTPLNFCFVFLRAKNAKIITKINNFNVF